MIQKIDTIDARDATLLVVYFLGRAERINLNIKINDIKIDDRFRNAVIADPPYEDEYAQRLYSTPRLAHITELNVLGP